MSSGRIRPGVAKSIKQSNVEVKISADANYPGIVIVNDGERWGILRYAGLLNGGFRRIQTVNQESTGSATVYTSADPPPYPVTSVNGKTGAVKVTPYDLFAENYNPTGAFYIPVIGPNFENNGYCSLSVLKTALSAISISGTPQTASDPVAAIAFVALAERGIIDAVTAGEHAEVFEEWQPGVAYEIGRLRRYKDALYRCLQAHTSQEDWAPDVTPALWKRVADPAEEWPEWSQPIGTDDAYMKGDKTARGGKHWVSTVDNNVWEPGVYGWKEIVDDE